MDEIDAIGGRRFSEGTSADREIQRTLMELLSQLDGFDVVGKVRKVLRCGLIKSEKSCHLLQTYRLDTGYNVQQSMGLSDCLL